MPGAAAVFVDPSEGTIVQAAQLACSVGTHLTVAKVLTHKGAGSRGVAAGQPQFPQQCWAHLQQHHA